MTKDNKIQYEFIIEKTEVENTRDGIWNNNPVAPNHNDNANRNQSQLHISQSEFCNPYDNLNNNDEEIHTSGLCTRAQQYFPYANPIYMNNQPTIYKSQSSFNNSSSNDQVQNNNPYSKQMIINNQNNVNESSHLDSSLNCLLPSNDYNLPINENNQNNVNESSYFDSYVISQSSYDYDEEEYQLYSDTEIGSAIGDEVSNNWAKT